MKFFAVYYKKATGRVSKTISADATSELHYQQYRADDEGILLVSETNRSNLSSILSGLGLT